MTDIWADILRHFQVPFTDPVLIMATALTLFLLAPLLFERLKIPGIIGMILAGASVGPNALGLLERSATVQLLGSAGLLYIMFIAGLEIDLNGFRRYRNRSLGFGFMTFTLPQGLGTLMAVYLLGFTWPSAILLASMFASHTLLAYPIASRLGISKNEAVTTAVGGTIITDTAALLVLAVVAASVGGELNAAFWLQLVISLTIYVALVFWGLPRLGRWFFRRIGSERIAEFSFVLAVLFISSFLAELAGVEAIIGAFLAGLALNRLIPDHSTLMNRIEFFGNSFFIPFFLLSVGMLIDVRVLAGEPRVWTVAGAMVVTVMVTKLLAAKATERLYGYSSAEGWVIFGLSVSQAAATLAAVLVGYNIGLFDDAVLNGTIMMILVTCLVGPFVTQRYGSHVAVADERKPYDPNSAPHRILVPLANPLTADALLDVAFVIRDPRSTEPVFPLAVVPEGDDPGAQVAGAEKMLAHSVMHAAAAEVPIMPLTRVAQNTASGMMRAVTERRITDVVIGWNGESSTRRKIFGSVIDHFLEVSQQQVLVCKINHPLPTMARLIVILPPFIDHHVGYYNALGTVKVMAARLGVNILAIAMSQKLERYRSQFDSMKPDAPTTMQSVVTWADVLTTLQRELKPTDLPLILSVRRGTPAWTTKLDRLPQAVSKLAESMLVLYLPDLMPTEASIPRSVVRELEPQRCLFDLPALSLEETLVRLLRTQFPENSPQLERVLETLTNDAIGFRIESLSDSFIVHARVSGISHTKMFLAVSPEGIERRSNGMVRHAVGLLLTPTETPPAEHLDSLDGLGRLLNRAEHMPALHKVTSFAELLEWELVSAGRASPESALNRAVVPMVMKVDSHSND